MRQHAHTQVVDQTRRVRCVRLGSMLLNGANLAHRVDETDRVPKICKLRMRPSESTGLISKWRKTKMFEEMKLHRALSTKIMTNIIRLSLIGMIVASFVGVGILSAQSSLVSKARPSARAKNTRRSAQAGAAPTVRNVVLVHGAFADGSSWAKVIPLLEAKGLHATAVQNPLSSLADDVAATRRAIARQDGPVILVGHSWAGMVISEAGNDPKVAGLVYVAAIVPDEGQAASDVLKPYAPSPGLGEAKPDASGFLSLTRKGIDEDFVPDLRPAARVIIYAIQGAWNSTCLADKVSVPAWTTKPSWFIVAANDRMLPPEYEEAVAEHIHATTTTLATGHVPMF